MKTCKRTLSVLLVAVMLLSAAPMAGFVGLEIPGFDFNLSAKAATIIESGSCGKNVTYTVNSDGVLTIKGTGKMNNAKQVVNYMYDITPWIFQFRKIKKVVIENGVTSIGTYAFFICEKLTSVTIPDSVTSIGEHAFEGCSSLPSITIPGSVTSIGKKAFNSCDSLAEITILNPSCTINDGSHTIPSATVIKGYDGSTAQAYAEKHNRTFVSIGDDPVVPDVPDVPDIPDIPDVPDDPDVPYEILSGGTCGENVIYMLDSDGLLTISGTGAMQDYNYDDIPWYSNRDLIREVVIENGVTSIGEYAFSGCASLTSVTIPDSVMSIGRYAFSGTALYNDANNWDKGVLYISDWLITAPTNISSCEIKNGTIGIASGAFEDRISLTSVTIPDGLKHIGDSAFCDCGLLVTVNIPDSVISIGCCAFSCCFSLPNIVIPAGVTTIESRTFELCDKLTTVTFSENSQLTSIGDDAFKWSRLTSIDIPAGVTSIGENAFYSCPLLTAITVDAENPSYCSLDGVLFNKEKTTLISYPPKRKEDTFNIPDSVTSINKNAFYYCTLLSTITIPDSVTSIGYEAFNGCNSLTDITILNPNCMIDDGSYTIPTGSIINGYTDSTAQAYAEKYNRTFLALDAHEHSYTSAVTLAATCCTMGVMTYTCECEDSYTEEIPFDFTNHVGGTEVRDAREATKDAPGYTGDTYCLSCNTKIVDGEPIPYAPKIIASGTCGTNVTYTLDSDGLLTIAGTGEMENYSSSSSVPWYYNRSAIKTVSIENGVTSIGGEVFAFCDNLTKVTIADSVEKMEHLAFYSCENLTDVTFGVSLKNIGIRAFESCTKLQNITIPSLVTEIGDSAFYMCGSLKSVELPDRLKSIGAHAFRDCPALEMISLPDSITYIGMYAFYNTPFYTDTQYCHDGVIYINNHTITSLTNIETHTIRDGTKTLAVFSFHGCQKLKSIFIPVSVSNINTLSFHNTTALTDVYYAGSEAQWNAINIDTNNDYLLNANIHFAIQDECEHKWNDGIVTTKPTCTADGVSTFTCTLCEATKTEAIAANGHTAGAAATCTQDQVCTVCGETLTNKLGHDYNSVVTSPTCTKGGYTTYTCTVCGDNYQTDATPAAGHTPGADASCTQAQVCTVCGETLTNKLGHDYNSVVTSPTCTKGGYTTNTCTVCGDSYTDKPTPSLGHDWDAGVLDPEPTPEQNGIRTYTCKRCSKTKTEIVEYVITIIASGSCGEKLTWTLDSEGTLSVSGEGEMTNYASASSVGWYAYRDSVKKAILADSVTSIGDYAFYSCTSLTSVTIPNSVDNIGKYAFYECVSLSDVYYVSSAKMWRQIVIGEGNEELTTAKIHYAVEDIYNLKDETYSFANFSDNDARGGHCFGMSMTSSAYYLGILNRTIIDEDTTKSLYSFAKTDIVKSPICYYQDIQGSTANKAIVAGGTHYLTEQYINIGADWAAVVDYVKNHEYDHTGALQIAIRDFKLVNQLYYYVGGHAVNFLYYKEVNGQQRLYIYDNNFPNTETYLYKAADGNVYQAPRSTFDGAVECVAIRDVETYFEEAANADKTRFIYAKDGAINVLGDVESYKMDGYDSDAGYIMYEISEDMDTVQIVPLEDHATFTYCDQDVSFGLCDDDTMGLLQIGRYDSSTGAGEIQFTIVNAPELSLGDVDNDGAVTSSDARLALRAAVKLETLTDEQLKAADADKDGEITSSDARLILRAAVGLETL